jgi:hypothetical protein
MMRKIFEATSEAKVQAASSLEELGRKKAKKVVKKTFAAVVQRVPRPSLTKKWRTSLAEQVSFLASAVT